MKFSIATAFALLCAPLIALAQQPNAFIIPDEGLSFTGGQPTTIKWTPSTDGTITLVLRSGSADNLEEGTIIASQIDNSGSYTWTPSNSLTRGNDYTIQIVDDNNPENVNYTPYFVLNTSTTEEKETPTVTLAAPTMTLSTTTAKPTGDATTITDLPVGAETPSGMATDTSANTAMTSPTGTDISVSAPVTTDIGASPSNAVPNAQTPTGAAGGAAESASSASEGAAAKATAMAGMLGVVAMGAFAL